MAKQTALKFSGTVGGVIFYERLGGFYMRSKPTQVRQTTDTKKSASLFGQANRLGKSLRQAMAPLLPNPADRQMMHRFSSRLQQWLAGGTAANPAWHSIPQLQYMELGTACSLRQRCKAIFQVQWQQGSGAMLTIPALNPVADMTAPAGTTAIQVDIMLVVCGIADTTIQSQQTHTFHFNYSDMLLPAQEVWLPIAPATGNMVLVSASIRYCKQGVYCTDMAWLPAVVVDAVYIGS